VSNIPLRTRLYTLILVVITTAAFVISWLRSPPSLNERLIVAAIILLVMVLVAEILDVSFPQSVITFHVSISAAFAFAAGLTVGPLVGGIIVAIAHFADGLYARRQMIKTVVNAGVMGLSTQLSGTVYFALADGQKTPLGSLQNLSAATLAAFIFTVINTGSLAIIVSPVMGVSPIAMWKANTGGLYIELISIATLGSLIPVLVNEHPLSIVLLLVPLLLGPHLAFKGIRQAHRETRTAMESLADALERRDPYTFRHSIRVTTYVAAILRMMPQIPRPTAEAIIAAAHVHDLGKVGSRDGSLQKPGALSDEERREIEQHAVIGAEIVGRLEVYKPSVETIRHHHERWDGTGYPDGLAGERIPLGARIVAVADAFDAMTSDRVYRPAMSFEAAFAELRQGQGAQFDPQIVEFFHQAFAQGLLAPQPQPAVAPQPAASAPQPLRLGQRLAPRLLARRPQAS
jgi:putative nucleotidyltransferase with HDIG domain